MEWSSYFRFAAPPSGGLRFRSVFRTSKSASNSKPMRAKREIYTEHQQQTGVGLSNDEVTSAIRRHLAAVSASGLFTRLRKALLTRERWQLDEICLQNTNSKPESAYQMVQLLPLDGATYH
jgi:hypothetical protein